MFTSGLRIGLLGGSFNPAHAGHVHISLEAKKRLGLDHVVWLVSPQNPLKAKTGMAPYAQRLDFARNLTASIAGIKVSDIEQRKGLFYSCDTIAFLKKHHPQTSFVWLMGADNWQQLHRWRHWEAVMDAMPVAICDRAPFSHQALHGKAAIRYKQARLPERSDLCAASAPAWQFLFLPRHPLSATEIRNSLGDNAFSMA
jgi:nicotinate-nucleotide adenylyltransferase